MKEQRIEEIINGMSAFDKKKYHKNERLEEMFKLQKEMVELTFNGNHAATADLKLWDVEAHFVKLNEECGNVAENELEIFKKGSKEFCNLIKAEISGSKGELKAFRTLEHLRSQNVILKNIELNNGELRTELDAVVITSKCITIVEVKNTSKNIFIDEMGHYYRTGEFLKLDCDIARKMDVKEKLLRDVLLNDGVTDLKIQKLVVFTNNKIEVQNKYSELKTCFVSQLAYIIDGYKGETIYSYEDMENIKASVESAACMEYYPADFDVEQYKMDFAILMSTLEEASATKSNVEMLDTQKCVVCKNASKNILVSKIMKYAVSVATGFTLGVLSSAVVFNSNREGGLK